MYYKPCCCTSNALPALFSIAAAVIDVIPFHCSFYTFSVRCSNIRPLAFMCFHCFGWVNSTTDSVRKKCLWQTLSAASIDAGIIGQGPWPTDALRAPYRGPSEASIFRAPAMLAMCVGNVCVTLLPAAAAQQTSPPHPSPPTALSSVDSWRFTWFLVFFVVGMNAVRICNNSLIARDILDIFRSTSYFASSPLSPLGAAKASIKPLASERHASYSRHQTLNRCQSSRSLGRTAASIPHTAVIPTMPTTQDHSSFANYLQAAVTHIDLGESL